mmetsp:Transcript_7342/g.22448  ORF Transcript_7342/g.22448 Transcript_7342/m.22448 type:complete len:275 (-) Transcript_7342:47-871(-)
MTSSPPPMKYTVRKHCTSRSRGKQSDSRSTCKMTGSRPTRAAAMVPMMKSLSSPRSRSRSPISTEALAQPGCRRHSRSSKASELDSTRTAPSIPSGAGSARITVRSNSECCSVHRMLKGLCVSPGCPRSPYLVPRAQNMSWYSAGGVTAYASRSPCEMSSAYMLSSGRKLRSISARARRAPRWVKMIDAVLAGLKARAMTGDRNSILEHASKQYSRYSMSAEGGSSRSACAILNNTVLALAPSITSSSTTANSSVLFCSPSFKHSMWLRAMESS